MPAWDSAGRMELICIQRNGRKVLGCICVRVLLSVACLCVLVEWICMHLRLFLALCVIMCVFVYVCADCVLLNRCAGSQARAYVCQSGVHQARFGSATVHILLWQFAVPHCICLHKLSLDIVAHPRYALGLRVCCVCLEVWLLQYVQY